MPEQPFAASRLAKSRENYKAEEEALERELSPVPPAERFFDTPTKAFDLDAVEHEYDEFGLAMEPTSSGKHQSKDSRHLAEITAGQSEDACL